MASKSEKRNKVAVLVGAVLFSFAGVALITWIVMQYGKPGDSDTTDKVSTQSRICTFDDVRSYNTLLDPTYSGTVTRESLISSFSGKAGYDNDPSCVYMLAQLYIVTGNLTNAKTMADILDNLAQENLFPDVRIDDLAGLRQLRATLNLSDAKDSHPVGRG